MSATDTMDDANPYSAPDADLGGSSGETYSPKFLAVNGRIGRLRYLAYSIGISFLLMLIMIPLVGTSALMGDMSGASSLSVILYIALNVVAIVVSVIYARRRLNDLNRSGWWFLLFIVPIVNLLLAIYLIFFPGTDGSNNFGPPPVANSIGVLILGWMFPVLMLLGILAAIAGPMMAGV